MVTKLLGLSYKEGMMLPPGLILDMIQVQKPGKEDSDDAGYEDDTDDDSAGG